MGIIHGIWLPLLGSLLVFDVSANTKPSGGCNYIIDNNAAYLRCMQNFKALFTGLKQGASEGKLDKNSSDAVFCSDEGRAAVGCVLEFFEKCPQVFSGDDDSGTYVYDNLETIQFTGVDIYCDALDEGCVDTFLECTAPLNPKKGGGDIFSKVHSVSGVSKQTDLGPAYKQVPTFFGNVPKQITILCGPMEEMLTYCAFRKHVKIGCPKTVGHIEKMISNKIEKQQIVDGHVQLWWPNFPAYEEAKKYIVEKCPTLPTTFTDDALPCIEASVGQTSFVDCYNVNTTSESEEEEKCDAFKRSKECITKWVEPDCGEKEAKILIEASHLFSNKVREQCLHVGGVSALQASVVTMIGLVTSCLLLLTIPL